ncbi:MAG: T9SS type A sorting domain-containing protein [Bacteroidales bacterium]|nr:T9SS type A sorting domain-containing protein [Bacteroidales bacterium]
MYFATERHEQITHIFFEDNENFIAVLRTYNTTNKYISKEVIYSFSNFEEGDTARWSLNLWRQDTVLHVSNIIRDNGNYILEGGGMHFFNYDSIISGFDWIMKLDENRNLLWEKMYNRSEEAKELERGGGTALINMGEKGYLSAGTISKFTLPPVEKMYMILFNNDGDTIKTKLFSQYLSGRVQALTYNHDSSALLLHKSDQPILFCDYSEGALILDTVNFDTIGGVCYKDEENWGRIQNVFDASISSTGELIVAGKSYYSAGERLSVFKYDTSYNLVQTAHFTDPDTNINPGWVENLDINQNGEICITGSFDNALGQFPPYYCWVYVAKLDSELNLMSERYIGGDASYDVYSIVATGDGGIAVGGYRYDYLTNGEEEGDAFVIKTDAGLWVSNPEYNFIPVHSALVYPNPGNNQLNLRTTLKNTVFRLYDVFGNLVIEKGVNNLETPIDTQNLPRGTYFWTISQNSSIVDRGKWIKL